VEHSQCASSGGSARLRTCPPGLHWSVPRRSTHDPSRKSLIDGVQIIRAAAGTGRTFVLDAAREAWHDSGVPVLGCALSARAACELHDQAGVDATTIARLRHGFARSINLSPESVFIVDEAGMVGTRDLATLADAASRANAKLVLVGYNSNSTRARPSTCPRATPSTGTSTTPTRLPPTAHRSHRRSHLRPRLGRALPRMGLHRPLRHRHEALFYITASPDFLNQTPEPLRQADIPLRVARMLSESRAEQFASDIAAPDRIPAGRERELNLGIGLDL
jgi:hypothetical protein